MEFDPDKTNPKFDPEDTNPHLSLEDVARAEIEKGLADLHLGEELKGDPEIDAILAQVAQKEVEIAAMVQRLGLNERIRGKRYERNGEVVVVRRIKQGLMVELENPATKTIEHVPVGMFEGKLLDQPEA